MLNKNMQLNNILSSALDVSKYELNSLYKLSHFTIKETIGNNVLLYNVINGFYVELTSAEYDYIFTTVGKDLLKSVYSLLVYNYIIVPNDFDDNYLKEYFEYHIWNKRPIEDFFKEINSYVIFTTTDCNARCFYCYERGAVKIKMSSKIAEDTANFIVNEYKNFKNVKDPIHLQWFGGEPLYNSEVIDIITDILIKNDVKFTSNMISNGLLFTPAICNKAKTKWNLNEVQITLDGTEKVYNKVKHYANIDTNDNPFNLVIDNIKYLLAAGIEVNIRLNADLHNIDDLKNLIRYLHKEIGHPNHFSVYLALLFENIKGFVHTEEERMTLYSKIEDLMMHMHYYKYSYYQYIFKEPNMLQKNNHCMLDSGTAITISPEGKISNCEHNVDKNFFGSIYTPKKEWDMTYVKESSTLTQDKIGPCCKNCPFYICCRKMTYCEPEHICSEEEYHLIMETARFKMISTYYSIKEQQNMNRNISNNEDVQHLNRIANELELMNDYKSLTLWERIKILFGGNVYRDPHTREQTTYNGNKEKES